ncbi:myc box-dependent-interacting protein 1 isoform X2 [Culicoides brevitarsis]|uniref:myc box-dependent-interacting protein 1 isoform X2 n=1 Tax=Culicoides brevitarsis TaxID=469753 RepID=UPI00307CAFA0
MAESKSALIAKSVQKHAGRAKEKILQNLGKVDRTADEIFDEHLNNFNKQQTSANKLQKEFNNYIRCIRATQAASKNVMDVITEIYESQWVGADALAVQMSSIEVLWQDFSHKLGDQVLIPLNTYTAQFPEMKKKIEKRGRKLVDFDSQRHSFQSLQSNSAKRKDDLKITKAKEQLDEARRTYELLNTELHDELPALYDSRILFLVSNLQTLFASEQVFHSETSKIFAELEAIVDKLATDSQKGSYTFKKTVPSSPSSSPTKSANIHDVSLKNGFSSPSKENSNHSNETEPSSPTYQNTGLASNVINKNVESESDINKNVETKTVEEKTDLKSQDLPEGVLYKVKATYKYNKEDTDELSFDVGDEIFVIEYDDPEEQEEGWLMGIKESTKEKGMFPANFTKPI